MEECSYCGESFDDEEAYVRHLRDEHEGELGRIDRQRVERLEPEGPSRTALYAVVAVLGLVIVGIAYTTFGGGGGADPTGIEAEPLPEQGDDALLENVESYESQGTQHVDAGTDVDYEREPPTSGPHYGSTVQPGFYESSKQYEDLVHNLEHGHVVIYYDSEELGDDAEQSLREFAAQHNDHWAAVVVVPNPKDDPNATVVVTAWTKKLELNDYDPETVRAFLAEYLGRGPENPVR